MREILRPAVVWVLPTAVRAVALYEGRIPGDSRPRDALDAARRFADGGRRDQELRRLSWAAQQASSEAVDRAAKSAARSASLTAALAFMHPDLVASTQLKHLYGPVVYAAQAQELAAGADPAAGDHVLTAALARATRSVRELAAAVPELPPPTTRLGQRYAVLDRGLRGVSLSSR